MICYGHSNHENYKLGILRNVSEKGSEQPMKIYGGHNKLFELHNLIRIKFKIIIYPNNEFLYFYFSAWKKNHG